MSVESAIDALRDLARGSMRTKTSRLRDLFDEVEYAKAAGVTSSAIVEALKKEGLEFTVRTLEVTLSRIRKERRRQEEPRHVNSTPRPGADQQARRHSTRVISTHSNNAASPLEAVELNSDLSVSHDVYESFKAKE